jgi:2-iminobutanoate/2-iminopropanoate deaminase
MKRIIKADRAPAAIGPYSQAAIAGGMVYISGQLPADPETGELETDPARACDRALINIAAILAEIGLLIDSVVKVNIYLTNMADFSAVNEAYAFHFQEPYPARACVAVKELPRGAVLEIEAIASLQ